jgi:hypothetical protein
MIDKHALLRSQLNKLAVDQIEGGKADDMDTKELSEKHKEDPKEIEQQKQEGTAVELEHTNEPAKAEEIAKDHIEEIPDYYDRLEDMEEEAEVEKEKDLGDPSPSDKQMIINFIKTQPDLDDETLHNLYVTLGVDPHEGEEIVYAALQQMLAQNPAGVDAPGIEEKEVEMDEEEEDE